MTVAAGSTASTKSVFIGGDFGFQNLSLGNTAQLMASGRGGIYTHGSAISPGTIAQDQAIWQAFAPEGAGILEVGQGTFFDKNNAYDAFCVPVNYVPQEITLDLAAQVDGFSASDLTAFKAWVDAVRSRPELAHVIVAPFATPGGTDDANLNPLTGENGHVFSTSDSFWGPLAQACLYGKAIAIDLPAGNFIHLGDGWPEFIESQIKWGNANGIKVSVVFSPTSDGSFVEDVQQSVSKLVAAGAIPTDYSVENYTGVGAMPVAPGASETSPESLNAAALWLAKNAPNTQSGMVVYPTTSTTTAGSGTDTLILQISEDAYLGNANFTVSVDGKQVGGTFVATALHMTGASQAFTLNGNWGAARHTVAVTFLNDAYGGSPSTDRNLYVGSLSYDGVKTTTNVELASAGSKTFTVGQAVVTSHPDNLLSTAASATNAAAPTAETLHNAGDDVVWAGAAPSSIVAGAGSMTVIGGSGNMSFLGGSGSAAIVLQAGTTNRLTLGNGTTRITMAGNNTIHLGAGAATFDFAATAAALDTIFGFKVGVDHIALGAGVTASASQHGSVLMLSDNVRVDLIGTHATLSDLLG